ncbi:SMYD2, partial [Symbiodinium necroappetens]
MCRRLTDLSQLSWWNRESDGFWGDPELCGGEDAAAGSPSELAMLTAEHLGEPALAHRIDEVAARVARNGFQVVDLESRPPAAGDALFHQVSFCNHCCAGLSNATWTWSASKGLLLRATRAVSSGEELTISYIGKPWCDLARPARRRYLKQNFNFVCLCKACANPDAATGVAPALQAPKANKLQGLLLKWLTEAPAEIVEQRPFQFLQCYALSSGLRNAAITAGSVGLAASADWALRGQLQDAAKSLAVKAVNLESEEWEKRKGPAAHGLPARPLAKAAAVAFVAFGLLGLGAFFGLGGLGLGLRGPRPSSETDGEVRPPLDRLIFKGEVDNLHIVAGYTEFAHVNCFDHRGATSAGNGSMGVEKLRRVIRLLLMCMAGSQAFTGTSTAMASSSSTAARAKMRWGCMDLVVVSETRGLGVAFGGPLVYLEGSWDWVRLSLAFAHLGTYSLRAQLSTMDPTETELNAITDLAGVFTWAGVTGFLEQSLRPAWDTMAASLHVPGSVDAEGNSGPLRDLTLVEQARIESTRRVALLRMGIPPDSMGTPGPSAPAPVAGPGAPAPGGQAGAGSRRLKLSAVLDPTLDADVVSLGNLEIQKLYADYKAKFGDHPSVEADPSADQLASLKQVVAAGSVPYADFSLFGPHGLRLLRKQTFTSYTLNVATGEWSKKEQPGPSSYHSWVEAKKKRYEGEDQSVKQDGVFVKNRMAAVTSAIFALAHTRQWIAPAADPSQLQLILGTAGREQSKETAQNRSSVYTKSLVQVPPVESTYPDYALATGALQRPPSKGDLPNWLAHYGLMVCCLDLVCDTPCDVLDEAKWSQVEKDINDGNFAACWAATPCGTFSPLREVRPGPRPLRTVEEIEGVGGLSPKEKAQLKEANILVERTFDALSLIWDHKGTWGLENPVHGSNRPELWQMPLMRQLAQLDRTSEVVFDQCRLGLNTVKPTKIFIQLPRRSHESTAGKRTRDASGEHWASRVQGEYPPHLCQVVAHTLFQGIRQRALETEDLCKETDPGLEFQALVPKEPRTEREEQNSQALGGMRNPRRSLDRVQGARQVGRALHKLLRGCLAKWPGLKLPAKAILRGEAPDELGDKLVDKVRTAVLTVLGAPDE